MAQEQAQEEAPASQEATSQEVERAPAASMVSSNEEEFKFSWLDPEKKVYVIQNRKYRKAGHALFSAGFGAGLSQPYRHFTLIQPRVAFYISESFGLEGFFQYYITSNSSTYTNLVNTGTNVIVNIREFRTEYAMLLHWAPWYAKINMFNALLYFDWQLTAGVGRVATQVDTRALTAGTPNFVSVDLTSFYLGTGQLFHLSENWIVRLDLLAMIYQAPALETTGVGNWFTHFNFTAGLAFKL